MGEVARLTACPRPKEWLAHLLVDVWLWLGAALLCIPVISKEQAAGPPPNRACLPPDAHTSTTQAVQDTQPQPSGAGLAPHTTCIYIPLPPWASRPPARLRQQQRLRLHGRPQLLQGAQQQRHARLAAHVVRQAHHVGQQGHLLQGGEGRRRRRRRQNKIIIRRGRGQENRKGCKVGGVQCVRALPTGCGKGQGCKVVG